VIASIHGLSDQPVAALRTIRELSSAAEATAKSARSDQLRAAKELYIGNIPQGMPIMTVIDKVNTILVDMGATIMPGKPIVSGWLGGEGQFAFVEFRTPEECSNALSLNGYLFEGTPLKVGRPRTTPLAIGDTTSGSSHTFAGAATQFSLDDLPGLGIAIYPPIEETGKLEKLVLVGAPIDAVTEDLKKVITQFGPLAGGGAAVRVDNLQLKSSSLVFEFIDIDHQRKCAHKSPSLRYDRDHRLAVVRVSEAVMRGYISLPDEQFSTNDAVRISPTRILWFVSFPASVKESELKVELNSECSKFGKVETVDLMHVEKDRIALQEGTPLADTELIAVVVFEDVHAAIKCRKYMTGAKCFYLNEEAFAASDYSKFENNMAPYTTDVSESMGVPILTPTIRDGLIISVEKEIIANSKQKKRKEKLAPEDLEIID